MNKDEFFAVLQEGFSTKEYKTYDRRAATMDAKPFYNKRKDYLDNRLHSAIRTLQSIKTDQWPAILEFAETRIKKEHLAPFACALANFSPERWGDVVNILSYYAYEHWPYLKDTKTPSTRWLRTFDMPKDKIGEPLPANSFNVLTKDEMSLAREEVVSKATAYLIMNLKQDSAGHFCSYEGVVQMHREILKDCFPTLAGVDRAEAQLNTFRFNSFYQDISDTNLDLEALRQEKPALSVFEDRQNIHKHATLLFAELHNQLYAEGIPAHCHKALEERKHIFARAIAKAALEFNRIHPFCDSNGTVFDTLVSVLAFHQKLSWDKKTSKSVMPDNEQHMLSYISPDTSQDTEVALEYMTAYIENGLSDLAKAHGKKVNTSRRTR